MVMREEDWMEGWISDSDEGSVVRPGVKAWCGVI